MFGKKARSLNLPTAGSIHVCKGHCKGQLSTVSFMCVIPRFSEEAGDCSTTRLAEDGESRRANAAHANKDPAPREKAKNCAIKIYMLLLHNYVD